MVQQNPLYSALDKLLSEIEGDKEAIKKSADVLLRYATNGDYQGRYEMAKLIPEENWSWPAYDEQVGIKRYQTRCGWFLRRLGSLEFSAANLIRMKEANLAGVPLSAEFSLGNPKNTPDECMCRNGEIIAIDNLEINNQIPCDKLTCSCAWIPYVDFSKPITPSGYISTLKSTIPIGGFTNEQIHKEAEEFAKRNGLSPGKGLPKANAFTILRAKLKYWIINKL